MLFSSAKHTPEQSLVKGCLEQNPKAQKALYDTYKGKMFGVCLRYAKNHEQAQDFLQEGFIKVFEKLYTFKGEGSLEGWIRKVIIFEALRILRSERHLFVVQEVEEQVYSMSFDQINSQYNTQEILETIQKLPYGYRVVFNMYALEGYSHKEIAQHMGISESTSKSQLSRARSHLMRELKLEKINTHYVG